MRADINNCSAFRYVLQNSDCLQLAPFSVKRQKYAEVTVSNDGESKCYTTMQYNCKRAETNAHVIGVEQLVSIAGVRETRQSGHRLVKHRQILALVNLQTYAW